MLPFWTLLRKPGLLLTLVQGSGHRPHKAVSKDGIHTLSIVYNSSNHNVTRLPSINMHHEGCTFRVLFSSTLCSMQVVIINMTLISLMLFKLSCYYISHNYDNSKTWQDRWVWKGERGSGPPILHIHQQRAGKRQVWVNQWPTLWRSQGLHSVVSID